MKNSLFSLWENHTLYKYLHSATWNEPRDTGIKNDFDLESFEVIPRNQSALNLLVSSLKTLFSYIKVRKCKKVPFTKRPVLFHSLYRINFFCLICKLDTWESSKNAILGWVFFIHFSRPWDTGVDYLTLWMIPT